MQHYPKTPTQIYSECVYVCKRTKRTKRTTRHRNQCQNDCGLTGENLWFDTCIFCHLSTFAKGGVVAVGPKNQRQQDIQDEGYRMLGTERRIRVAVRGSGLRATIANA